jgi:hypothetical protein
MTFLSDWGEINEIKIFGSSSKCLQMASESYKVAVKHEDALTMASRCFTLEGIAQCLLMHNVDGDLGKWCKNYLEAVSKKDEKLKGYYKTCVPEHIKNILDAKAARAAFWQGKKDSPLS